jgi:hypothetical protein
MSAHAACMTFMCFEAKHTCSLPLYLSFTPVSFVVVPSPGSFAVTLYGMRLHILPCRAWHPLHAAYMLHKEELACQRLCAHVPARSVHFTIGMLR